MKRSIFFLMAAAAILTACRDRQPAAKVFAPDEPNPDAYADTLEYLWEPGKVVDLGSIREIDGKLPFVLSYRNDSGDTLVPKMWHASCGCAVPKLNNAPVAPGAFHKFRVSYNPAFKKGPQQEEISIMYEDRSVETLYFKVEVIPYVHPIEEDRPYHLGENFYTSHKVFGFLRMERGGTQDMYFRYGNGSKEEAILRLEVLGEYPEALHLHHEVVMAPDFRDTMHVKLVTPAGFPAGDTLRLTVQPYINDVPTAEAIRVSALGPEK